MKSFNTKFSGLLKQSLDVYNRQQKAISQNIANVNNLNYERAKTDFSSELKDAVDQSKLKTTKPQHITSPNFKNSGNANKFSDTEGKIEMTQEMSELAENQVRFDFASQMMRRYYSGISTSILGRNK